MSTARRRRGAAIAGLVVAVAFSAAAVLLIPGLLSPQRGGAAPSTAASGAPSTASQATEVATALDQLAIHPERLLPSSLRGSVQPTTAVPAGTKVSARRSSWQATSARSGTMQVILTDARGARTSYLAVMVEEKGSWRVLETEPLQ